MTTPQQPEHNIVIKEETIDIEYEPLPTQCQGQQMAAVKAELDVSSVTTQPVVEVSIKEEIEVGPTEFLPQEHISEVPQCKVEPGSSGSNLLLEYNAPRDDVTANKQALRQSSRYLERPSTINFGSEGLISSNKCNLNRKLKSSMCTGGKPFACDLCSYVCNMKCMLVVHKRTHTGEKPFACDICSYKGIQKSALLVHMRTHTGEKPFACDLCSYKCKVKSALVVHKRTHTGEMPFACELCSYKCKIKSNLVRHMYNHTGERPFVCVLCSYRCKENRDLVRHMRVSH